MQQRENKLGKIADYAFYTALVLEMLFVLLDKSEYIIPYETWLFRFTFLLFVFKIACTKYTVKQWICIGCFCLLGIVSFLATDREEIIRAVALVAALKGMDLEKVLKITFFETLAGCVLIVLLSAFGIYGAASVTGYFRGGGIEETRYCFGMGHPNALHCMFFVLVVLGMAIYNEKCKWYNYLLLVLANLGVYFFTDSRTGMLMVMAAILTAVFLRYGVKIRDKKVLYILGIAAIAACVLFTVFVSIYGVEIPFMRQIDIRINGRFQYGKSEGGIQYWSLFSNPANRNYFDMGFMRMFYWYGIVPTVIYYAAVCMLVWNCYKKKAYGAFLVVMMFMAYSLIEAHAVSVYLGRNYVLLFMGAMWYTIVDGERGSKDAEYKA